MEKSLKRIQPT